MTDYAALNQKLLAERNAREDPERQKREQDATTLANLARIEELAAEFHRLLEARDFQLGKSGLSGKWLKFEDGSEKLAWMLATEYHGPDDYDWSWTYVMLDGQLVFYQATGGHHNRIGGWIPFKVERFLPYRQYVEETLRDTQTNLTYETQRHIGRLNYMIGCLS